MKTRKIKVPLVGMKIVKHGIETRISEVIDKISFKIELNLGTIFGVHEWEEVVEKNRDAKDISATILHKKHFDFAIKHSQHGSKPLSKIIDSEDGQEGVKKIIQNRDGKSVQWEISAEAHEKASKTAQEEFFDSYPPFVIEEAKDNYKKDNNTGEKPMNERSYICGYIRSKLNSNQTNK